VVDSDGRDDLVRAEQRVGQVLRGKYRIDRVLGVGGMAAVYAATHRNQKQFAIKVLHPELSFREDIRTRFLREGYAANSVRHPGAVAVLDDDVAEDGAAFLVMELLDGLSVEQLWEQKGRRLAVAHVLGIAHQLLDALAAAHKQGIVHRDIKPANLFVCRDGQLKVLDFGIARVRDAATSGAQATGTGMLLGTPAFMAPEQAMGKSDEIEARTDLWAVGATLFTLLSGQLVHPGETGPQLMILAATSQARGLIAVAPEMPPVLAALVDRAVAFRKEDRWRTAEAMRDGSRDTSLALFGRLPLRESLVPMFDDRPDPFARTRDAGDGFVMPTLGGAATGDPPIAPRTAAPTAPAFSTGPAALTAPAVWTPPPTHPGAPATFGLTTSHPVTNDPPISVPAGVPRARPLVLGIVAIVGLLVVVGGAAVGLRSMAGPATSESPSSSPSLGLSSSPSLGLSSSPSLGVTPPALGVTASLSGAPVGAPSPASSGVARSGDPGVAASPSTRAAAPPASASARAPLATSLATSASSAASSATAASSASAPVCRVVSFFDADGDKHFRQECH
jgi:eukaryotic-like serine/threonine-protein kinase